MSQVCSLTIVIPTLGGGVLRQTIQSIMESSLLPEKILIVIPEDKVKTIPVMHYKNIEILVTKFRGQVQQRIVGFLNAKTEFVMQLDDDIDLANDCIETLFYQISTNFNKIAIAPALRYKKNNTSVFFTKKSRFYYWLINGSKGYQAGSIYLSGTPEGVNFDDGRVLIQSEWLYGGCVLHRKNNLILENYYPFKGKAYCEDLIHSLALIDKGVNLFFMPKACAYFEIDSYVKFKIKDFIYFLIYDFKARNYFIKRSGINSKRIYFFYIVIILNYIKSKIFNF